MKTIELPAGGTIRGRPIATTPTPPPTFGVYLVPHPTYPWPHTNLIWPDFRTPRSTPDTLTALKDLNTRAKSGELVEIACRGGIGRTGTAIAALAVLDGLTPTEAFRWTRATYHPRAIETPWQRWWLKKVR
ncbi:protein-tyrosine phosphatase family protein [Actinokineospora pegani]|uniref:protein-tyrosine phosphatase family protein n=1 Tax=Actinokineospora pegani TaxID=2654637 RepID=UPI0012E9D2A7|nr:protein-tyrosine phosphatase family protein [Actinokineospora pegani]